MDSSTGIRRRLCVWNAVPAVARPAGLAQATVAVAHAIATVVYRMLKYQVEYEPLSVGEYEKQYEAQPLKYLQKKAAKLGLSDRARVILVRPRKRRPPEESARFALMKESFSGILKRTRVFREKGTGPRVFAELARGK